MNVRLFSFRFIKHPDYLGCSYPDKAEHRFHAGLFYFKSRYKSQCDKNKRSAVNYREIIRTDITVKTVDNRQYQRNACNRKSFINLSCIVGFRLSFLFGNIEIRKPYNCTKRKEHQNRNIRPAFHADRISDDRRQNSETDCVA